MSQRTHTAFIGSTRLLTGPLPRVALAVRAALEQTPLASALTFDDSTGRVVDLDLRGDEADILARLAPPAVADDATPTRGRPKLGVVAREVTLLPRHWEWLGNRPGGASNALRRLVEEAMRSDGGRERRRAQRDAAYRFMAAMAGDLPGFEEASRALFADDRDGFDGHSRPWPADITAHVRKLAWETPVDGPPL